MCVCEAVTADELWRGVLAESGAGSRKGRGKRTKRKMKKDLNRGQNIGEGKLYIHTDTRTHTHLIFSLMKNIAHKMKPRHF